jgi:predicted Holliday junction resolvase-like endonuclease
MYSTKKPGIDWLDRLQAESERLDKVEERIEARQGQVREQAKEKGRSQAMRLVRKIDPVFTPRKLNPDDAKVIFHPIDYIVFKGMSSGNSIRSIVFLDRQSPSKRHRQLQGSIEHTIERERYEWVTLRVQDDGKIKEE